jgi:hypothetical protein
MNNINMDSTISRVSEFLLTTSKEGRLKTISVMTKQIIADPEKKVNF